MEKQIPFGYEYKDGKLIVNELEAVIVRWVVTTMNVYCEHPPTCLVREVVERFRRLYDEELLDIEAAEEVSYSDILDYLTRELNLKYRLFANRSPEKDIAVLQNVLAMSLEEVECAVKDTVPDDSGEATWRQCIQQLSGNTMYIGYLPTTSYGTGNNQKHDIESGQYYAPIISREMYDAFCSHVAGPELDD